MLDHIVVDVEIQKTIEETPGGWDATDKLGVAVAVVYEYLTDRFRIYGPEDVHGLQERLEKADRISGFNTFGFDFPVIYGASKAYWHMEESSYGSIRDKLAAKSDDLLRRIWTALGFNPDAMGPKGHGGWKLDDVVKNTLNRSKIGNGVDAPKWYQAGQIHKVINYCVDDVALERDLCDFIERFGYVLNAERKLKIPPWNKMA